MAVDTLHGVAVLDTNVIERLHLLEDPDTPGFVADLTTIFLRDGWTRQEALHQAATSGDMETVHRIGHALKGSSGTMGAPRLAALGAALETAGSSGDQATALALSQILPAELDSFRLAIAPHLGDPSAER